MPIFEKLGLHGVLSARGVQDSGGLTVNAGSTTPLQGVTLKGQCGVLGVGTSCSRLTSGATGVFIVTVGNGPLQLITEGLQIEDLEFNDASGTGAVAGAIKLNLVEHFAISGVYCQNFTGGYCIGAIGGSTGAAFTQFGVITNLTTSNTKFPIQTTGKTSSINLYGGDITCGLANAGVGSIGMDIGFTNHSTTECRWTSESDSSPYL